MLDRMDFEYEDQYKDLPLKLKPSEYWRRQCKATFQYDRVGTEQFAHLPSDVTRKMTCENAGRFYGLIH